MLRDFLGTVAGDCCGERRSARGWKFWLIYICLLYLMGWDCVGLILRKFSSLYVSDYRLVKDFRSARICHGE